MRHYNIPVFVPHQGCPNTCVFCNQHSISGASFKIEDVDRLIEEALLSIEGHGGEYEAQIAFFGGSFTGIDEALMTELLAIAKKYTDSGRVSSVRLSTRPDYIDVHKLEILKKYGVTHIELGSQSMCEEVLAASKRGHTPEDTKKASELIKQYGFKLVLQMMTGLPKSSLERDLYTAEELAKISPEGVRIYPTVVFKDTELEKMAIRGEYVPSSVEKAVHDAALVTRVFIDRNIPVIRTGLQSHEGMNREKIYGGAYHPALGEMVQAEVYYTLILEEIERKSPRGNFTLFVSPGEVSKAMGQKKHNYYRIMEKTGLRMKVREEPTLKKYEVLILDWEEGHCS